MPLALAHAPLPPPLPPRTAAPDPSFAAPDAPARARAQAKSISSATPCTGAVSVYPINWIPFIIAGAVFQCLTVSFWLQWHYRFCFKPVVSNDERALRSRPLAKDTMSFDDPAPSGYRITTPGTAGQTAAAAAPPPPPAGAAPSMAPAALPPMYGMV